MATATDYDAPRQNAVEEDSLEELQARRAAPSSATVDVDENDAATFELPDADLLDEDLTVTVVPMQLDEFRCERCFLVGHRNQRAYPEQDACRDCS